MALRGDRTWLQMLELWPEFKIANMLVQLDMSTAVEDALQELDVLTTSIVSRGINGLRLGNHIWQLCCAVLELSARTPPTQQSKLVTFIAQLQKKVQTDPKTGPVSTGENQAVWTDMPKLGYTIADAWNVNAWDPDLTREERLRWESKNAFLAQLLAVAEIDFKDASKFSPIDFSSYALRANVVAFERNAPARMSGITAVRTAAYWFIYAADKLWDNVENERSLESWGAGDKYKDKGWKGYNCERWTIWEHGLRNFLANGTDPVTKDIVEAALEQIERVSTR